MVAQCPKIAQKESKQVKHNTDKNFNWKLRSGGFKRQRSGPCMRQIKSLNQMSGRFYRTFCTHLTHT